MTKQSAAPKDYRKPCTLCQKPRDVLIRCQIDESAKWHFVCPGKCWKQVSGGVVDGDRDEEHKYYVYGGVWKNKHEAVSGKMPKKKESKKALAVPKVEGEDVEQAESESEAVES